MMNYVIIRLISVNIKHDHVDMQHYYVNMHDEFVNMRLELTCCMLTYLGYMLILFWQYILHIGVKNIYATIIYNMLQPFVFNIQKA